MKNASRYQYGNKALNIPDVSSSVLLEYLQNQKRIATELQAPQGEIELLDHIIKKLNALNKLNETINNITRAKTK